MNNGLQYSIEVVLIDGIFSHWSLHISYSNLDQTKFNIAYLNWCQIGANLRYQSTSDAWYRWSWFKINFRNFWMRNDWSQIFCQYLLSINPLWPRDTTWYMYEEYWSILVPGSGLMPDGRHIFKRTLKKKKLNEFLVGFSFKKMHWEMSASLFSLSNNAT